ncbi:MAG: hypothetical protein ACP5H2_05560 [Solirubrobacteraceae bacterium]
MPDPKFRFVCAPSALSGTPAGWAQEMLQEGELALLGQEGIDAINTVAHDLGQTTIAVVRNEIDPADQDETVIASAGTIPLIWVAEAFSYRAHSWARERGAMTLLTECQGPLDDAERRRIDRFVAILGRQSE